MNSLALSLFILCILFISTSWAYLPGVHSKGYFRGESIPLKVNSLTSIHTQLPYLYYSLPFCRPREVINMAENLGEILMGDRIENSPYEIAAGENLKCKLLCRVNVNPNDLKLLQERIKEEYRIQWLLESIPATTPRVFVDTSGKSNVFYEEGFLLGRKGGGQEESVFYIHNHVSMKIFYYLDPEDQTYHVVAFEIDPQSVLHPTKTITSCPEFGHPIETLPQSVSRNEDTVITFTYSVTWEQKDLKWASRMDIYSMMTGNQIHWFSITNSVLIIFFLTGMIALIMIRTLRSDVLRYNQLDASEELQEETGWKLVHGDVFRPPIFSSLLSSLVGSGVQVFGMVVITLGFTAIGFLSPENRGTIITAMIILFVSMGLFAGYFSARTYMLCHGSNWKSNTTMTAFLFPGICFGVFLAINFVLAAEGSSGAVPFWTLIELIVLWFGVSVPLVFIGSHFGTRRLPEEQKVTINPIPREIPVLPWYSHPIVTTLLGGILPFGVVFVEMFFIFTSLWLHQFYLMFGFLALVFVILVVTSGEIAIVLCYFQLCNEDYNWWWKSFLTPASSVIYMMIYSCYYFYTKIHITRFVSVVLFFGYGFLLAFALFVLTGFVGFWSCLLFVTKIYNSIKTD